MKFIKHGNNNPEIPFNTFQEFLSIPHIYNMVNNSTIIFDKFILKDGIGLRDVNENRYILIMLHVEGIMWRLGIINDVNETPEDNKIIEDIISYRK